MDSINKKEKLLSYELLTDFLKITYNTDIYYIRKSKIRNLYLTKTLSMRFQITINDLKFIVDDEPEAQKFVGDIIAEMSSK